jgi:hypothetical protein
MLYDIYSKTNIMKKIIRLTEDDLTRIVRRVISEQGTPRPSTPRPGTSRPGTSRPGTPTKPATTTPATPALQPSGYINKSVNIYMDRENKDFYETVTIKSVNKSSDGAFLNLGGLNGDSKLTFSCLNKQYLQYDEVAPDSTEYGTVVVYNTTLTTQLAKTFCGTSSGGSSVPKADFASNSSNKGADFA